MNRGNWGAARFDGLKFFFAWLLLLGSHDKGGDVRNLGATCVSRFANLPVMNIRICEIMRFLFSLSSVPIANHIPN